MERKVQISCIFCGFICGGCGCYDFSFDLLLFLLSLLLFVKKRSKLYVSILSMCEYVWVCINVWVCMICFFVSNGGDYIISINTCISCCLVSCWMMRSMSSLSSWMPWNALSTASIECVPSYTRSAYGIR